MSCSLSWKLWNKLVCAHKSSCWDFDRSFLKAVDWLGRLDAIFMLLSLLVHEQVHVSMQPSSPAWLSFVSAGSFGACTLYRCYFCSVPKVCGRFQFVIFELLPGCKNGHMYNGNRTLTAGFWCFHGSPRGCAPLTMLSSESHSSHSAPPALGKWPTLQGAMWLSQDVLCM